MLELKENEKLIKEYSTYYLIEVKCPDNASYRTTIFKERTNVKLIEDTGKYDMDKRLDKKRYYID